MKDDFKVQRVAPTNDRTVNYRPASRPVSMDMVGRRTVAPSVGGSVAPSVAAAPAAPAATPVAPQKDPIASKPLTVSEPAAPPKTSEPIHVVHEASAVPVSDKVSRFKGRRLRPVIGGLAALVILSITGYVSFDTWLSTNVVRKTTTTTAAVQGQSATATEGSDETIVTQSAISAYAVAPDMPRVLSIEKLNIKARVLPMGINAQSAIEAPINIYDSGWYTGSAKPGTPGVAFIDAHASGATREGLFAYLDTLTAGDVITVEKGNGEVLKYAVRSKETKKLSDINMAQVLSPRPGIEEGLTLMTCTGKWMASEETYDHRAIVYAERI